MVVLIRPIKPNETEAAVGLILSVARGVFGWEKSLAEILQQPQWQAEFADVRNYQDRYLAGGGRFLVAVDDDQLIGTGAIRIEGYSAEIKRLWLAEAYQKQGLGYRLLTQLLDAAAAQEVSEVRLATDMKQVRAIAFYQQAGFKQIEPFDHYDTVFMALDLSQWE